MVDGLSDGGADVVEGVAQMLLGYDGRVLGLAIEDREVAAEGAGRGAHQFRRHHGPARADHPDAGEVARLLRECLHHAEDHGWHGDKAADPLLLHQAVDHGGIEQADQHDAGPHLHRAQHRHAAAAGVEQRHGVQPDIVGRGAGAVHVKAGIVEQTPMAQHRSFRKAGGAAGVLDLGGVVRLHVGQVHGALTPGQHGITVGQQGDFADSSDALRCFPSDLGHGVAAIAFHQEQSDGARLLQHIAQFLGLERRVGRDQHQSGERTGIFHQHPFRDVVRPDHHPLSRREAGAKRLGQLLGVSQQFAVGPAALGDSLDRDFDQSRRCGVQRRHLPQLLADTDFPDWR